MSTSTVAPPFLNGTHVVPAEVLREADFLQRILHIRDEVFASKHPRIHLPAKVIDQVVPRHPQTAPSYKPQVNGAPNGIFASHQLPPRPESSLQAPPTAREFTSSVSSTQRPYAAKPASSGIDPVLLTKSDHLIKAELQLKRQQIERLLKDQFDKKGRGNDNEERDVHLNVEECLTQAHLRVPPVSGLRPTANNSDAAESFDENSYYSSKADSWSSEELDHSQNVSADIPESLTAQSQQPVVENGSSRPIEHAVIDLDEEAYEPADDIEIYEPESAVFPDETEEEDYSPPPADVGLPESNRGRARDRGNNGGANRPSRRQSPSGPVPPLQNPRRRRRDELKAKKQRQQQQQQHQQQQQTENRVIDSPEPYIKEEPQSPPPFAPNSDPQPSKRRALQPVPDDLEILPAQDGARPQPVYYREAEPASRTYREYEELSSPVPRMPQRRVLRDDHDLRRVASLQYARRPYSPGAAGEMYTAEPRHIRSASHAFVERAEAPIYREASMRPVGPRYVQERSRSPVYDSPHRPQSPGMMGPPRRQVVVDQYGNRYYAAPVDVRESLAPPTRRMEADPYYERAVTREPAIRAPRAEFYEDEMVQRMPPPPRRYVEAGAEMMEAPVYRREASRRPVEVEYRPQYEEMGPPREVVPTRAYSMRPEVVRREVPEGYVRHESIQPGSIRGPQPRVREVSIVRHEPVEERRFYSVAPPSRRYVEDDGMEVVQDSYAPRVYPRY